MSVITEHGTGYTERDLIHNWAAEFAKRLADGLSETMENNVEALRTADDNNLSEARAYTDRVKEDTVAYLLNAAKTAAKEAADAAEESARAAAQEAAAAAEESARAAAQEAAAAAEASARAAAQEAAAEAEASAKSSAQEAADAAVALAKAAAENDMSIHKSAAVIDHPAGSVTAEKLADGAVGTLKLDDELKTKAIIGYADSGTSAADPDYIYEPGIYQWLGELSICITEDNTQKTTENITPPPGILIVSPSGENIIQILFCGRRDGLGDTMYAYPMQIYWRYLAKAPEESGVQYISSVPWTLVNRGGGSGTYSTTPVRIGTWVDGTPVWRVCFSDVIESAVEYYDVTCVKDISAAQLINDHMMLYHDGDIVGDRMEITIGPDGGRGDESSWYYARSDIGAYTNIFGFIEFASPQSNLK